MPQSSRGQFHLMVAALAALAPGALARASPTPNQRPRSPRAAEGPAPKRSPPPGLTTPRRCAEQVNYVGNNYVLASRDQTITWDIAGTSIPSDFVGPATHLGPCGPGSVGCPCVRE